MTNKLKAIFFSITIVILNSCINQESQEKERTIENTIENAVEIEEVVETEAQSLKFPIFSYYTYYKPSVKTFGFVSLSDIDRLSDHPDSAAVPKTTEEYFVLSQEYRKRFLKRTRIAESDTVYIYNYYNSTLQKIVVQKLKVGAMLSSYDVGTDDYNTQGDYHIGFEINPTLVKQQKYNIVYIGRQNPFVIGEVYPLSWEKVSLDEFPSVSINPQEQSVLKDFKETDAYKFSSAEYDYFIKEFIADDFSLTRMLVVKSIESNKTVCVKFFFTLEFEENLPLNKFETSESEHEYIFQFAGRLFKNKPPVFFGFTSHSAGCPYIYFLGDTEQKIEILCDNRH